MSRAEFQPDHGLSVTGRQIAYRSSHEGAWECAADLLAVVGEYTDANGPSIDDYYFVFVTKTGHRYDASFYSEGRDAFLARLGELLGKQVECGLLNSTDLASRVMWPPSLADEALFDFVRLKPSSWAGRIKECFLQTHEMHFTTPVREHLEGVGDDG